MSFMSPIRPEGQVERAARQPRIIRARVVHRDGEVQDIVIRNVSKCGIGASARGPAPVRGERIMVILPGEHEVMGLVRWFSGHAFGVKLEAELNLEALSLALQRQTHIVRASTDWQVENRHRVVTPRTDPSRIRRL